MMKDAIETLQKRKHLLGQMIEAGVGRDISEEFVTENKRRYSEVETALNLITSNVPVSGRSEQLHLCPVCNEKAGKSYLLAKLPTICQKCDHAWNRA